MTFFIFLVINTIHVFAQSDSIYYNLSAGDLKFKAGDYASSMILYEKAFNFSIDLDEGVKNKDSLFFTSLKQLVTVSGLGKASALSDTYFNQYSLNIYTDICNPKYQAIQIGIINNYIGVSVYNKKFQAAVSAYQSFLEAIVDCPNFRDVDLVQCSANAAMAYSELNRPNEAIKILPLLKYYQDSLNNWSGADYKKVIAYVKSKTDASPQEIISYYKNSAQTYTDNQRYAYALDVYESILDDYSDYLSNEELIDLMRKSNYVRDSTQFYHNDLYQKMMGQLGVIMIERTETKQRNTSLKYTLLYLGLGFSLVIIILLLFIIKRNKESKNYYKKLYELEKQFEIQKEKLSTIKYNFIQSNYTLNLKGNSFVFSDLLNALDQDFPELRYKIHQRFNNLSDKELQIIYCSLLNLSTKESANVLSMTHGAFRVAKNRLIKKVNCENAEAFQITIQNLL